MGFHGRSHSSSACASQRIRASRGVAWRSGGPGQGQVWITVRARRATGTSARRYRSGGSSRRPTKPPPLLEQVSKLTELTPPPRPGQMDALTVPPPGPHSGIGPFHDPGPGSSLIAAAISMASRYLSRPIMPRPLAFGTPEPDSGSGKFWPTLKLYTTHAPTPGLPLKPESI
jgi:hypothetical protein